MKPGSNIRLRVDGRYEARYLKERDSNGRLRYGCVYGKTPEEADRKRTELLISLRRAKQDSDLTTKTEEMGHEASQTAKPEGTAGRVLQTAKSEGTAGRVLQTAKPEGTAGRSVQPEKPPRIKNAPALDEATAETLDHVLNTNPDSAAFGFSLCLHMGISYSELCALQYNAFDMETKQLVIRWQMSNQTSKRGQLLPCNERRLPIPESIQRAYGQLEIKPQCYLLTDTEIPVESMMSTAYLFKRVLGSKTTLPNILPDSLQMTFIRRALEAGFGYETAEAITGINKGIIERRFKQYARANTDALLSLSARYYNNEPAAKARTMNLLILGAGSHGHAVMETAEKLGIFQTIQFLDDNISGPDIVGKCEDYRNYLDEYPAAFVAIGDNKTRKYYAEKLREAGFLLPRLIHPDTTISRGAVIGEGTIVMAQATVNASVVGECCIVASNALVGFGAGVGNYTHIDCGAMVMKEARVPGMSLIESGAIFKKEDANA